MKKSNDDKLNAILRYGLLGLTLIGFSFSIFYAVKYSTNPQTINLVLVLPFVLFLTPYLFLSLYNVKKIESKVEVIPRFLRDAVDNVESGMDLISAIKATSDNQYGVLNEDVLKLINQLSWGVDFEVAFINFAENIGSLDLKRDFLLVIEARKIGGHAEKVLRELSLKIQTENLRKTERKSNLSSNTFTGYVSFVIFIFIIVLVYNNLFVGLGGSLSNENTNQLDATNSLTSTYLTVLMILSYELAILSGFLFGLMQENNIISGAPHVVILVVIVFISFFFFIHY